MIKIGAVGVGKLTHAAAWIPVTNGSPDKPRYPTDLVVTEVWEEEDEESVADLVARYGVKRVERPEDMLGRIDGVWITDLRWERYPDLAAPFLKAGLPTFVNRPFAPSLADGLRMIETAEQHRAPLMSASCMRFHGKYVQLRNELASLKPVRTFLSVASRSKFHWYVPHAIGQLYGVLGGGVEYVHAHGPREFPFPDREGPSPFVYVHYRQAARHPGAQGAVALGNGYWLTVAGDGFEKMASARVEADANREYWLPLLQVMEVMIKTGVEPDSHEQIYEMLKTLFAMKQSFAEQREIGLDDLRP